MDLGKIIMDDCDARVVRGDGRWGFLESDAVEVFGFIESIGVFIEKREVAEITGMS
jgi:hypothetical protein